MYKWILFLLLFGSCTSTTNQRNIQSTANYDSCLFVTQSYLISQLHTSMRLKYFDLNEIAMRSRHVFSNLTLNFRTQNTRKAHTLILSGHGDYYPETLLPHTHLEWTDLAFDALTPSNLVTKTPQQHLNNTENFPYSRNSFDFIFMNKGLCNCSSDCLKICAGIELKQADVTQFLSRIIKIFNTENPRALSVLHGFTRPADNLYYSAIQQIWIDSVKKIESQFPVQITFLRSERNHASKFALVIRPRFKESQLDNISQQHQDDFIENLSLVGSKPNSSNTIKTN